VAYIELQAFNHCFCIESLLEIIFIIKNWIIGFCNTRVFIGFAIMLYMYVESLYHALEVW